MKTAGYIGSLLPNGYLSITANVVRDLDLHPNDRVQVVLVALSGDDSDERRTAARTEIWQQLDALRDRLSAQDCNLTETLLQAREEEDASR
jgi:hypothetical protein